MDITDTRDPFLVPASRRQLVAYLGALEGVTIDGAKISRGGVTIIEIVTETFGGCVVTAPPVFGDGFEMADLVSDPREAEAIRTRETAATEAEALIARMGGVPARLARGKWRPVMDEHRAQWAAHLAHVNIEQMRGVANENRVRWAAAAA